MQSERIHYISSRRKLHARIFHIERPTIRLRPVIAMFNGSFDALEASREVIFELIRAHDGMTERDDQNDIEGFRAIILQYLLDRVTSTAANIVKLAIGDVLLAAPDMAALHRSSFEAAVNLLYILGDPSYDRLRSFSCSSFEAEWRMFNGLIDWANHSEPWIAAQARLDTSTNGRPDDDARKALWKILNIAGQLDNKYPPLRRRCEILGELWVFYYDSRYRGLSSWQHGDVTRVLASSTLLRVPEHGERLLFETLLQVVWIHDLVDMFIEALAKTPPRQEVTNERFHEADHYFRRAAGWALNDAIDKYHAPDWSVLNGLLVNGQPYDAEKLGGNPVMVGPRT